MNMLSKKNIKQRIDDLFKVCRVFSIIMSTLLVALIISTLIHYGVIFTFVTFAFAIYLRICAVLFIVHIVVLVKLLNYNIKERKILLKLLYSFALAVAPLLVYIVLLVLAISQL